jgi:hypothetical protein
MSFPRLVRLSSLALALAVGVQFGVVNADEPKFPDPKVMNFKLPKDFKFKEPGPEGYDQIQLFGDPSKPGFYAVLLKWYPHRMTRPHFHDYDRYVYVVSGTWWVGSGPEYNPDKTYPIPAGSWVHHFARQLHYDGAKDKPCVLYIVGQGPAPLRQPEELK